MDVVPASPAPARTRKSGGVRRAQVIAAALELLHDMGVEGVTTVAIARKLGLSQAALFKHFPAKADVWRAAIDDIGDRLFPAVTAAAAGPGAPLDRLRRLLRTNLEVAEEVPAMTTLLFYREGPNSDGAFRTALGERSRIIHEMTADLIREAVAAGEMRHGLDVERAAILCLGIVQALLHHHHFIPGFKPLAEFDALFNMTVRGLGADGRK